MFSLEIPTLVQWASTETYFFFLVRKEAKRISRDGTRKAKSLEQTKLTSWDILFCLLSACHGKKEKKRILSRVNKVILVRT